MRDARDAEDKRLLEAGEIELLLAGWYETIVGRCVAQMRGPVGHDVAQVVCERLWRELKSGKHRDGRWPFRVIVHKVIEFTCSGWYEPGWSELELIEIDGPVADDSAATSSCSSTSRRSSRRCRRPTPRSRGCGCSSSSSPTRSPQQLGKDPNAVYQARFRISKRLREWLVVIALEHSSKSSSPAGRAASR